MFHKPTYPDEEHEGRLLCGDPVAIAWEPKRQSLRWLEIFAKQIGIPVEDLIQTGLTHIKPKTFPRYITIVHKNWTGQKTPSEFWLHLGILADEHILLSSRGQINKINLFIPSPP
jgi:hypothetical protein